MATEVEFHYGDARHQARTAEAGMWLFLASEMLFFGALLLVWAFYRAQHPAGFAEGARHTRVVLGAVNTVVLLTSSLVFAYAPGAAAAGRGRLAGVLAGVTAGLGVAFLVLKGVEWGLDAGEGLLPGRSPGLAGAAVGATLFFTFYYAATGLHFVHMVVGVGLVCWVGWRAWRGAFSAAYSTPVVVVGLYWSFVDMVWLVLFPVLYLSGWA